MKSTMKIMNFTLAQRLSIIVVLALSIPAQSESISIETKNIIEKNIGKCIALSDPDGWDVAVFKPGNYCITQNLHQAWPFIKFSHQRVPLSSLISINSDNVAIDLKGHRLSSTIPAYSGIFTYFSGDESILPTIIKNGKITTSSTPTVQMVDNWNLDNQRFGRSYPLSSSHGDISQYKPTVFVLENLILKSSKHAVIMQGKRNIIRNCKIIGGNGTVNVYGPNLLFESNTIILNAQTPKTQGDEKPVALYLEDAADSVVRNNKIVIKGSGVLKPSAIVLVNSPNVLLEHNIIRGTKEVYKLLDEHSSVKAKANDAK